MTNHCFKCDNWKPARTHHCSICNKCTLMMDHHCPWIANCVGYYNYKFFLLVCFYSSFLGVVFLVSFLHAVFVGHLYQKMNPVLFIAFSAYGLVGATLVYSVLYMLIQHLRLLLGSATSIECQKGSAMFDLLACTVENPDASVYNLNSISYVERIMGRGFVYWLLPLTRYNQLAYEFPTIPELTVYDKARLEAKGGETAGNPEECERYMEKVMTKYRAEDVIYHNLILMNNMPLPPGFVVAQPYARSTKKKEDDE